MSSHTTDELVVFDVLLLFGTMLALPFVLLSMVRLVLLLPVLLLVVLLFDEFMLLGTNSAAVRTAVDASIGTAVASASIGRVGWLACAVAVIVAVVVVIVAIATARLFASDGNFVLAHVTRIPFDEQQVRLTRNEATVRGRREHRSHATTAAVITTREPVARLSVIETKPGIEARVARIKSKHPGIRASHCLIVECNRVEHIMCSIADDGAEPLSRARHRRANRTVERSSAVGDPAERDEPRAAFKAHRRRKVGRVWRRQGRHGGSPSRCGARTNVERVPFCIEAARVLVCAKVEVSRRVVRAKRIRQCGSTCGRRAKCHQLERRTRDFDVDIVRARRATDAAVPVPVVAVGARSAVTPVMLMALLYVV